MSDKRERETVEMQLDVDDSYWTFERQRLHQQVKMNFQKFNDIFMSYQFEV